MKPDAPLVEHITVGALGCTCTIIADPATREAVVVDPGDEAERIIARLDAGGFRVRTLLHTHAHIDHVGATRTLCERLGAEAALHPADLPLAALLTRQAAMLQLAPIAEPHFAVHLHDGDAVPCGSFRIQALHTPGHTHGSTSFALERSNAPTILLTGDTLFAGGVGRWDLGGTSLADIQTSIRNKLFVYPDDAVVVPGHGVHSTIGDERRNNPYFT